MELAFRARLPGEDPYEPTSPIPRPTRITACSSEPRKKGPTEYLPARHTLRRARLAIGTNDPKALAQPKQGHPRSSANPTPAGDIKPDMSSSPALTQTRRSSTGRVSGASPADSEIRYRSADTTTTCCHKHCCSSRSSPKLAVPPWTKLRVPARRLGARHPVQRLNKARQDTTFTDSVTQSTLA